MDAGDRDLGTRQEDAHEGPALLARVAPSGRDDPRSIVPRRPRRPDGSPRRVGVEVEFAGIELGVAADVVAASVGGRVERATEYEARVHSETLGELVVEVDNAFLKDIGRARAQGLEPGLLRASAESFAAAAIGTLTPLELVTPPLPIDALPRLDAVANALGRAGATGTHEHVYYAFGVHYNPDVAAVDGPDLLAHLRAFLVLDDWLRRELAVDLSRRATPYVDAFPLEYVVEALGPRVPSERGALVEHYLASNPTRNRALDMLPLFKHLERERVEALVDDPRVNARPTFHYRLTNSRIGEPDWRATDGWRYWLVVEDLAADPERLAAMCAEYRALLDDPLGGWAHEWADRTRALLG